MDPTASESPGTTTLVQPMRGAVPRQLQAALLVGCAMSGTLALWVADPARYPAGDASLSRLLRGMALIKGFAVLIAIFALLWRFERRVAASVAVVYCTGVWAMTAAAMLIWQLAWIPLAAALFHVGLLGLLVTAWRDEGESLRGCAANRSDQDPLA